MTAEAEPRVDRRGVTDDDTGASAHPVDGVSFTVNGTPVTVRRDHPHLLSALRDELDITSPKDGCSPSGQCGCCTVHVDGKAVVSCTLAVEKVEGKSVVTLEGVDAGERDLFAEAFAACGGLQCGYCIPGIVMASVELVARDEPLERAEIKRLLAGNLCRCTGYETIIDAIIDAQRTRIEVLGTVSS